MLLDFNNSNINRLAQNAEFGIERESLRVTTDGKKEFIIGTEISIQEHLQYQCPDKRFYYLTQKLICPNMKSTTLVDLYNCVAGNGGEEILLDSDTITKARKCIDEMIRLGN